MRLRLNPPGADGRVRVTYIVDRNLNPTNVCVTDGFCAFYRLPGDAEAYVLPREVIYQKVDEPWRRAASSQALQGGHHPRLKSDWFAALFADLKQRYPQVWIHGMSPPEITHLSKIEKRPVRAVLQDLKAAGLDSIPGGGAEILVERVRKIIAPKKATTDEWLEVFRQWAALGGKGTATMMFGHVETDAERIEHMTRIRDSGAGDDAGRQRRVHRVHPVDVPARKHGDGRFDAGVARRQEGDGRRAPAHAEHGAALPAERAARAV
ncbi:MAG: radical SAM protein [Planctomycetota bacterium]